VAFAQVRDETAERGGFGFRLGIHGRRSGRLRRL
jgi:hypothetical protein